MDNYLPTEEQIQKVMDETGMDHLQARRHLQMRLWVNTQVDFIYPLGKSSLDFTETTP